MEDAACPAGAWDADCEAIQSEYVYESFLYQCVQIKVVEVVIANRLMFGVGELQGPTFGGTVAWRLKLIVGQPL
jgi:hypothetical protein